MKEALAEAAKKAVPFALIGLASCSEPLNCPVNLDLQAITHNGSRILYYDQEDLAKLDLSKIGRVISGRKINLKFFGNTKTFSLTTDQDGTAQLRVDLIREKISTRNPYLVIQPEGEPAINKRVSCGQTKMLKVLFPDETSFVNTLPTPSFTQTETPIPTFTATATSTPIPTEIPTPFPTRTPTALPENTPTPQATRTPTPKPIITPTPIPAPTPVTLQPPSIREYSQCGGTCNDISYENTDTVNVIETTNSDGTKTYSCSIVPGQCGNP